MRYMGVYITRGRPAEQGFQIALGGLGIVTPNSPARTPVTDAPLSVVIGLATARAVLR